MADIEKEIEDITTQKQWKIADKDLEYFQTLYEDVEKASRELRIVVEKYEFAKVQRKMAKMKMWNEIHERMPDVPHAEKLGISFSKKLIKLREEDDGPPSIMKFLMDRME